MLNKYFRMLVTRLAKTYSISEEEAKQIVWKSGIVELHHSDPQYIDHVPQSFWIEEIWNNHLRKQSEEN